MIPRVLRIPSVCLAALTLCAVLAGPAHSQTWQLLGPKRLQSNLIGPIPFVEFFGTKGFTYVDGDFYRTSDFGERWIRLEMPGEGSVRNMARLGPLLFAGTWDGVYRSEDGGDSWIRLPLISARTSVEAMFVHRGVLLVENRSGGGIYRYSDSSGTWTPLGISVADAAQAMHAAADDSALYIGGAGLRKSLDGGTTWMDLKAGLNAATRLSQARNFSGYVRSLLTGKGGLYAGLDGAVYRSADGGSTWSPLYIHGSDIRFSALALAGDALLAGTSPDGVWRIPLDASPPTRIEAFRYGVQILRASDSGIFAATSNDILRSGDGGKTWSTRRPGNSTWEIGILTSQNGVMHAGGRGGPLFRSLDQGVTWDLGTELPELNWIKSMAWNGNALFAVSGQGTNDIYASEDGGTNWTKPGGDSDSLEFEILAASAGTLYATALDTCTGSYVLLRTDDKGRSWKPASDPIHNGRPLINALAFGESWIHAGTDSGYVRIDAATGKVEASGLKGEFIRKMSALEGRLFASGEGAVVWRSLDQGLTWEKTAVAVPLVNHVTAFAGHAQTVYAGTYGSGVYRSTNGGSSWEPFNTERLERQVMSLVLDGGRLYAGTSASVYSLEVGGTGTFSGGRFQRGKSGIRKEPLFGKGMGLPYLEVLQGEGRYRILRLDGRQVADGLIGSNDGADR